MVRGLWLLSHRMWLSACSIFPIPLRVEHVSDPFRAFEALCCVAEIRVVRLGYLGFRKDCLYSNAQHVSTMQLHSYP